MQTWVFVSEIVRNLGLPLAALVGAALAWRKLAPEVKQAGSAATQVELARRAHVTELFNRAAGQLGDGQLEVRLAAIYVLREIGRDFPDLADPVFELLAGTPSREAVALRGVGTAHRRKGYCRDVAHEDRCR